MWQNLSGTIQGHSGGVVDAVADGSTLHLLSTGMGLGRCHGVVVHVRKLLVRRSCQSPLIVDGWQRLRV